jgi:hypothetical protein
VKIVKITTNRNFYEGENMLNEIFNIDRRLRIDHKKLLALPFVNEDLIVTIDCYLADFAIYNNLTAHDVLQSYDGFVKRYSEDIRDFIATCKYPIELEKESNIDRIDYDLALILSPAITIHRHKIIDNIRKYCSEVSGKTSIIGVGSGLELELLNLYCSTKVIEPYDINISKFVKDRFNNIRVMEHEFSGKKGYYNNIFAIELLEHLTNPYYFMSICYDSLKNRGRFFITTATNVPQFDHLFNFQNDNEFKNEIHNLGFEIIDKEDIPHDSFNKNLNAKNTWYVLEKNE